MTCVRCETLADQVTALRAKLAEREAEVQATLIHMTDQRRDLMEIMGDLETEKKLLEKRCADAEERARGAEAREADIKKLKDLAEEEHKQKAHEDGAKIASICIQDERKHLHEYIKALRKYGQHALDCKITYKCMAALGENAVLAPCSCGFSELLRHAPNGDSMKENP